MSTKLTRWFRSIITPCEACHGSGTYKRAQLDDLSMVCPQCKGTGKVEKVNVIKDKLEVPCPNPKCKKGKVIDPLTKEKVDCDVCDGLNRIIQDVEKSWTGYDLCPTCNGEGVLQGKNLDDTHLVCTTCHGLGKRVDLKKLGTVGALVLGTFLFPPVALVIISFGMLSLGVSAIFYKKKRK